MQDKHLHRPGLYLGLLVPRQRLSQLDVVSGHNLETAASSEFLFLGGPSTTDHIKARLASHSLSVVELSTTMVLVVLFNCLNMY